MKVMEKITSNESEREGVKFRGDKAASSHFNLVLLKTSMPDFSSDPQPSFQLLGNLS